jgi:hypothetical protein
MVPDSLIDHILRFVRIIVDEFQTEVSGFHTIFYRFAKKKCRSTETSGVGSGILNYRNFGSVLKHEVSVERRPDFFFKFRAKMNYCVCIWGKSLWSGFSTFNG